MNLSPQPTRAVYRSNARRDCLERALVLQSADIDYKIVKTLDEYLLIVAAEAGDRATIELEEYARERLDRPPRLSAPLQQASGWPGVIAFAAVLLLVAVLQDRYAFSENWIVSGKTNAGLIRQGQWWRTVTALTLHANTGHLAANIVFGSLFGLFTGRLLGSGLAWAGILLAGALGNALNAYVQPTDHSSIGASTAVFGALGILSAHAWKHRRSIEGGWIRRWTPIVGGVILLAYTGLGGERTDVIAHVTGFIAGLLLGGLFSEMPTRIQFNARLQVGLGFTTLAILTFCWMLALRP